MCQGSLDACCTASAAACLLPYSAAWMPCRPRDKGSIRSHIWACCAACTRMQQGCPHLNRAFSAPRICTVDAGHLARLVRDPAHSRSRLSRLAWLSPAACSADRGHAGQPHQMQHLTASLLPNLQLTAPTPAELKMPCYTLESWHGRRTAQIRQQLCAATRPGGPGCLRQCSARAQVLTCVGDETRSNDLPDER